MIGEGAVLFRIEHFEQGGGRIAAEVRRHLVDFIQQEQGVTHPDLAHVLQDLARHRADVGPPMATDLGLVTHPAQTHANELAVHRAGDGAAQRGLAHTRRAHQAENRSAQLLDALLHRQILDDAFLDRLQAVVILIQKLLRLGQIDPAFGFLLPRHIDQPVQVVAHHRRLG